MADQSGAPLPGTGFHPSDRAPSGLDAPRINPSRARSFANCLASSLNSMIETQMGAYPESWTEADKRELAELHLFGDQPLRNQIPTGGML